MFGVTFLPVLWSPAGAPIAGVPGPRRSADECDAGWFAPVATRRRSMFGGLRPPSRRLAVDWRYLRSPPCAALTCPRAATLARPVGSGVALPRTAASAGNSPASSHEKLSSQLTPACALARISLSRARASTGGTAGRRPDRFVWSGRVPAGAPPRICLQSARLTAAQGAAASWQKPVPGDNYSVLLNSAIATAIITRPMTATMPSDSHSGTAQPAQVMLGRQVSVEDRRGSAATRSGG